MTKQTKTIVQEALAEFFRENVMDALHALDVAASSETEFYLVHLLASYGLGGGQALGVSESAASEEPLALVLHRAVEAPESTAIPLYQRIGDRALVVSGFFNRSLERLNVSQSYYRDLGQGAYDTLASMMHARRDRVFAQVFGELAEKFAAYVEVLIEISATLSLGASGREEDLLERWAVAQSARAGTQLVRGGLMPLWRFGADDDGEVN